MENEHVSVNRVKFSKFRNFFQSIGLWLRKVSRRTGDALGTLYNTPLRLQAVTQRDGGNTGASIRTYALQLAADKSTTFSENIENFIQCTKKSKDLSPHVAMRNMRQFMSGMKNYLVYGEQSFENIVEKERKKLKANETLNVNAILEGVMHELVVRPLRVHLYRLFVKEYTRTGAIQLLARNIQYARSKLPHDLGINAKISTPSEQSLRTIYQYLTRLQQVDSPLEKLENLLACITTIFNSVKSSNTNRGGVVLSADDLLPLFAWVLVQGGMVEAEIEAEFMWGLLEPSLLSGEGGYYLTSLFSAVHLLKNLRACYETQNPSLDHQCI